MLFLKQSTAYTAKIGPFLDSTDGNTQETGLTIAQADVVLSKNGGAFAQKNDATSCTHDAKGMYGCPLNVTDTGTLGKLQLLVHVAGALAVWHEFMVVAANVYDSLFGGTDYLDVAIVEQANIDFGATQKASITAAVPTVTAIQSGLATPTNITAGTITTVTNLTNAPTAGDLTATMKASVTGAVPTVGAVADGVWDEAIAGHLGAGSTGNALDAAGSAGDPWSTAIPGAYGAGTAGKILGDNINAPIGTVDTVVDSIKTVVDNIHDTDLPAAKTDTAAVKVQTDKLAFTVANQVDANVLGQANIDFGALQKASVNAEVADVLKVDTVAEMSQAAPPASPTILEILNHLYRRLRNKVTDDGSNIKVYNDAKDTVLFKAAVADNGSTFSKDKYESGA